MFRAGRDEIIDAACLSAIFAVRLLIRAALGERDPDDANLSIADLIERLGQGEQNAVLAQADLEQESEHPALDRVRADIRTWVEWHEFFEQPKGTRDRAEFYIKLGRASSFTCSSGIRDGQAGMLIGTGGRWGGRCRSLRIRGLEEAWTRQTGLVSTWHRAPFDY